MTKPNSLWFVTNCGKEILFLGELEEILDATQPVEELEDALIALIFS
ncbi:hypothetical protein Lser_V15G02306 [Lactuca serriola]